MLNKIFHGDCLKLLSDVPNDSIDLIKADLPFEITQNIWDVKIPFIPLWEHYLRIIKPKGSILLNSSGLFTAIAIMSNPSMFKYDIIWEKTHAKGHLNAKKQPLRAHESILVFYNKLGTYNPQKSEGHKPVNYFTKHKDDSPNYGKRKTGTSGGGNTDRYPRSVVVFKSDTQKSSLHPTQKPVALEEYLIKTYSNEGDVVLDNCCGSGTVAIACLNTNRNFICIEKDYSYYNIAVNRINDHVLNLMKDLI